MVSGAHPKAAKQCWERINKQLHTKLTQLCHCSSIQIPMTRAMRYFCSTVAQPTALAGWSALHASRQLLCSWQDEKLSHSQQQEAAVGTTVPSLQWSRQLDTQPAAYQLLLLGCDCKRILLQTSALSKARVRVGLLPWPATQGCVSSCSAELRSLGSICNSREAAAGSAHELQQHAPGNVNQARPLCWVSHTYIPSGSCCAANFVFSDFALHAVP
jgi:hypothetical protein